MQDSATLAINCRFSLPEAIETLRIVGTDDANALREAIHTLLCAASDLDRYAAKGTLSNSASQQTRIYSAVRSLWESHESALKLAEAASQKLRDRIAGATGVAPDQWIGSILPAIESTVHKWRPTHRWLKYPDETWEEFAKIAEHFRQRPRQRAEGNLVPEEVEKHEAGYQPDPTNEINPRQKQKKPRMTVHKVQEHWQAVMNSGNRDLIQDYLTWSQVKLAEQIGCSRGTLRACEGFQNRGIALREFNLQNR